MKRNLDEVLKEKNEKKIYKLSGQNVYLKIHENKQKKEDVKRLLAEGRFLELYEKYGEKKYKEYLNKMMDADIKNELGVKHVRFNVGFFDKLKRSGKKIAICAGLYVAILPVFFIGLATADKKTNSEVYAEILSEYNADIEEYAKYINSLGLSDLEIVVKVMNDMWTNIDGYKDPNKHYDVLGYNRLSLYNDGYGVCRNMADDFSARMNAINPDYEAININVYSNSNKLHINNIERNVVDSNETVQANTESIEIEATKDTGEIISEESLVEEVDVETKNSFDIRKLTGNHMVSCITLKEEGLILIVDPTNPSIGVLKDGKIIMLSSTSDVLDIKNLSSLFLDANWHLDYQKKVSLSYKNNEDFNDLYKKYGIDIQNEVLDDIIEKYDESQYKVRGR